MTLPLTSQTIKRLMLSASLLLSCTPGLAWASQQTGTLTQLQGDVKIFSNPSRSVDGPAPRALFEGEYYSVRPAKIGDQVEQGNILRTAPDAAAKIVFDNGDQFHVGGGTAYRVKWDQDSAQGKTGVQLMHGKLRAVLEKGGPRSRMVIRARGATMGVRGTDFFVSDEGAKPRLEVTVLRGEVQVQPTAPQAKAIPVKAGFAAVVPRAELKAISAPATAPAPTLRRASEAHIRGIQKASQVQDSAAPVSEEVAEKLKVLEAKAVETTLKDIKVHDPEMYAQIKDRKVASVDELNQQAAEVVAKKAPKVAEEAVEADVYDKYFKKD